MHTCSNTSSANPTLTNWSDLNWKKIQQYVTRLRQRIFRAEQLGQTRKVRKLQRLLIISNANLLLSIRRVTQINQGKKTAGVDGQKVLSPKERIKLFYTMKGQKLTLHRPKPAKRLYIPKKNGKLRPLGIPTIKDRVYQNIAKNALEPQWEAKFESCSYGFRPKRSTHDAIANIFAKCSTKHTKKQWVFEGDFKGCFDNLNHQYILEQINNFPAKTTIKRWLEMGYVDQNLPSNGKRHTSRGRYHITAAGQYCFTRYGERNRHNL